MYKRNIYYRCLLSPSIVYMFRQINVMILVETNRKTTMPHCSILQMNIRDGVRVWLFCMPASPIQNGYSFWGLENYFSHMKFVAL